MSLHYFSKLEIKKQQKFQEFRTKLLLPLTKALDKIGVTPNSISYFGLFLLLPFVYFISINPIISSIFLILHVILDAFDGSLARYQKISGNSGSFIDMLCDHTGMVIVTISLSYFHLISGTVASVYIYLYTIFVIFIIIRNILNIPIEFAIRTKYFIYILFFIYSIFNVNYLHYLLIFSIIIMIPPVVTSFIKIKDKLKEKKYNFNIKD